VKSKRSPKEVYETPIKGLSVHPDRRRPTQRDRVLSPGSTNKR